MNKWNDIADGLPPAGVPLLVTAYNEWATGEAKYQVAGIVYYMQNPATGRWQWQVGSQNETIKAENVLAWTEYPKAYRPKED